MASLFIRHRVADFNAWKPVFDEHETARRGAGATAHSLHRDAASPSHLRPHRPIIAPAP